MGFPIHSMAVDLKMVDVASLPRYCCGSGHGENQEPMDGIRNGASYCRTEPNMNDLDHGWCSSLMRLVSE